MLSLFLLPFNWFLCTVYKLDSFSKTQIVTRAPVECMCRPCNGVDGKSLHPQELLDVILSTGADPQNLPSLHPSTKTLLLQDNQQGRRRWWPLFHFLILCPSLSQSLSSSLSSWNFLPEETAPQYLSVCRTTSIVRVSCVCFWYRSFGAQGFSSVSLFHLNPLIKTAQEVHETDRHFFPNL